MKSCCEEKRMYDDDNDDNDMKVEMEVRLMTEVGNKGEEVR